MFDDATGYCISYGALLLVCTISNIITDFIILLMPIPLILKLQTSRQKKRLIVFTFGMGGRYSTLIFQSALSLFHIDFFDL